MKKILGIILFVAVSSILVLVLRTFLPKYSGFLMFFFCFLFFDGYLWFSVRGHIRKMRQSVRIAVTLLYWMPLALLLCILASSLFVSFLSWNLPVRTYLQNFILILFLSKLFP
ncbi:MAG TPA: hypothetical protein PKG48_15880, partial [Bacteroidales bacterium]|nr:hypothetical protein [Bacteroidales bacterium]